MSMSKRRKIVAVSSRSPAARERPSFCTAAFRRHGIGYLDVVLAALSQQDLDAVMRSSPGDVSVVVDREEQRKLCRLAGYGSSDPAPLGFASVWYLHFDPKHDTYSPSDVELLAKSKKWPMVMAGVEESWVPSAWPGWRDGFKALGKLLCGGRFRRWMPCVRGRGGTTRDQRSSRCGT
jgi:hypothetical protein